MRAHASRAGGYAPRAILLALAASACGCAADPRPVPATLPDTAARPAASSADVLARQRQALEQALGAPLLPGNRAELLVDGPQTHKAMFDAIAAARDHVNLQSYILEDDEVGERLAGLLLAKRAAGAVVNVMYDSVGSIATPKAYFDRLREGGVGVCELNPVNPLEARLGLGINNRNHRKILVVDGRQAFTGGINISGVYSGGSVGSGRSRSGGWRDTHLGVEGPVVAELQRLFLDAWERDRCDGPAEARYVPAREQRGARAMRVVAGDPESGDSETQRALLAAIASAGERVWLTYGYFVPDPATLDALVAAAARGVDVRLMLPGFSDFWAPLYAGRSHYATLLAAGVRIYERRDRLLHAKTAVVDGVVASVGSTNLDWRSFVHNFEADVIVLDAAFGAQMERLFRRDMDAAQEITLQTWQARPADERVREWVARRFAYLL